MRQMCKPPVKPIKCKNPECCHKENLSFVNSKILHIFWASKTKRQRFSFEIGGTKSSATVATEHTYKSTDNKCNIWKVAKKGWQRAKWKRHLLGVLQQVLFWTYSQYTNQWLRKWLIWCCTLHVQHRDCFFSFIQDYSLQWTAEHFSQC